MISLAIWLQRGLKDGIYEGTLPCTFHLSEIVLPEKDHHGTPIPPPEEWMVKRIVIGRTGHLQGEMRLAELHRSIQVGGAIELPKGKIRVEFRQTGKEPVWPSDILVQERA